MPQRFHRRAILQAASSCALCGMARPLFADEAGPAKTPAVHTVLGPIEPSKIGVSLMHEHAPVIDWTELYNHPAAPPRGDRAKILEVVAKQLQDLHECLAPADRAACIVEATPIRVGRYPDLIVELAKKVPVHIVACTGFWCEAFAPMHPWAVQLLAEEKGPEKAAELFIRELREGMEDPSGKWGEKFTKVRCGIIKAGTSKEMKPIERRSHLAAAMASVATGAAITTHTTNGGGMEQAKLFLAEKVRPDRIVIGHQGHMDDRKNEEAHEYHKQLAALGCCVQFDRVGASNSKEDKVARQVRELFKAGHGDRVLVGHDHVPYVFKNYKNPKAGPDEWKSEPVDFTIVPKKLTKAFADAGLNETEIKKVLIDNPRRVLPF